MGNSLSSSSKSRLESISSLHNFKETDFLETNVLNENSNTVEKIKCAKNNSIKQSNEELLSTEEYIKYLEKEMVFEKIFHL